MALTRSENMARIRSRDTVPERELARALWKLGLRYRRNAATPVGRPDLVFKSRKVAVFVDGCQWHGCPEHYVRPRTRWEFWGKKLAENVARDQRQTAALVGLGWKVLRVWEHELRRDTPAVAQRIAAAIGGEAWQPSADRRVVDVEVVDPATDLEKRKLVSIAAEREATYEVRRRTTHKL